MDALVQQPVSVAIEGDKRDFQLYKSGVLSGACGSKVNHGVLAVGYGTLNGNAYWKLKNSWGSSWGEKGFVKIHRSQSRPGDCVSCLVRCHTQWFHQAQILWCEFRTC